jgi:hypothetical protein
MNMCDLERDVADVYGNIYRVSQEEGTKFREGVPYVKQPKNPKTPISKVEPFGR